MTEVAILFTMLGLAFNQGWYNAALETDVVQNVLLTELLVQ